MIQPIERKKSKYHCTKRWNTIKINGTTHESQLFDGMIMQNIITILYLWISIIIITLSTLRGNMLKRLCQRAIELIQRVLTSILVFMSDIVLLGEWQIRLSHLQTNVIMFMINIKRPFFVLIQNIYKETNSET